MAACGQVFKSCEIWTWAGGRYGDTPQHGLLGNCSHSRNPIFLNVSGISSSACAAGVPGIVGRERRSSCCHLSCAAIQYPPSRAEHRGSRGEEKEELEQNPWSRIGLFQSPVLSLSSLVMSSAVSPSFVSPDDTSNSTTKDAEQLEEFYFENDFLFVDETWGSVEKGDVSLLVTEMLSLQLEAGRVQKGSRVLVWGGSAALVQELCAATSPDSLVVAHLSMSVLGTVKEMNDDVVCWLGRIEDFPDSYGQFDAVFVNSLIVTAYSPSDVLRSLASLCKPGARIVISYAQGRKDLAVLRDKSPQLILQNLPDAVDIEKIINFLPLNFIELKDDPSFYLATLEVEEETSRTPDSANGSGEVSGSTPMRFPVRARGHVVQGLGRGSKQMGIPTANLDSAELSTEFLEMSKGVYFGWAQQDSADQLDGRVFKMVMNIGNRPTFGDGKGVTVEAHILHNFNSDFYGKELRVIVLGFIRPEIQYGSLADLVHRIREDIATAEELLDEDEMLHYAQDAFFVR